MNAPAMVLAGRTSAALSVSGPRGEAGQPVQRFRKELIRTGKYVKRADGIAFEVQPATLDHWAETFAAMSAAGLRVPVPVTHARAGDPEANRGWLVDCFVEGDRLVGLIDLYGEQGIALAATSDVSIYAQAEYEDGAGHRYQWPILHVALCTDPVIPGLGGFVAVAASQGQQPRQVPILSLEASPMPEAVAPLTPAPAAATPPATPKPGEGIRAAFKEQMLAVLDNDKLTDADVIGRLRDLLKARAKALGIIEQAEGKEEPAVAASLAPSDPMILRLSRKSRKQDLDGLVLAGKITPAVRDKLAAQWLPASDAALSLSLTQAGVDQFDALVAALGENDPVALGQQTGVQAVALSSPYKPTEAPPADVVNTMRQAAGLKPLK